jgi:hypothetical protein
MPAANLAAYPSPSAPWRKLIERASDAAATMVEDVRVDHRRTHITMPQQLLDHVDAVSRETR